MEEMVTGKATNSFVMLDYIYIINQQPTGKWQKFLALRLENKESEGKGKYIWQFYEK